jgi:hypothetical protein
LQYLPTAQIAHRDFFFGQTRGEWRARFGFWCGSDQVFEVEDVLVGPVQKKVERWSGFRCVIFAAWSVEQVFKHGFSVEQST